MNTLTRLIGIAAFACTCAALAAPPAPPPEPAFKLQLLPLINRLDKPVYVTHCNTKDLYVVEQTGKVRVWSDGKLRDKPFLDLSAKVNVDYECGLLSIAFHPKFAENGYVYAYYTATFPTIRSVIAEYKLAPGADQLDVASERILLHFHQPFNNHKGGQLNFGPDGMLYIATGDGGYGNDPFNNGQNTLTYLAKILRIDVTARRDPYAIPADNPFVKDNTFFPEIWAYGLRNPWRFSFDRATGDLYAADVGQDKWEEINLIQKGGNYGWRIMEGKQELHPVPPALKPQKMIDPVYQYNHNNTAASVTGGYVYRGKAHPALAGHYIFGDYVDGRLFAIKVEGGKLTAAGVVFTPPTGPGAKGVVRPNNLQPGAFGEDADGELYVCDVTNGRVYQIAPAGE